MIVTESSRPNVSTTADALPAAKGPLNTDCLFTEQLKEHEISGLMYQTMEQHSSTHDLVNAIAINISKTIAEYMQIVAAYNNSIRADLSAEVKEQLAKDIVVMFPCLASRATEETFEQSYSHFFNKTTGNFFINLFLTFMHFQFVAGGFIET